MEEDSWHGGIADLMTGLMMIFLLIAISYMITAEKNNEKIKQSANNVLRQGEIVKEIAATYSALQAGLYQDLYEEFKHDLPRWDAILEKDSTVRFNEPDILFETGSATLRENFKIILDDFFPRYLAILTSAKYMQNIDEIRIEGHTSSVWEGTASRAESYLKNSRLSQERAHSVLAYCYQLPASRPNHHWLHKVIRANGLSYGIPVLNEAGHEDQVRSRRVEFKSVTRSQEKMLKIVEQLQLQP